jgi:hypothetical protein
MTIICLHKHTRKYLSLEDKIRVPLDHVGVFIRVKTVVDCRAEKRSISRPEEVCLVHKAFRQDYLTKCLSQLILQGVVFNEFLHTFRNHT